MPELVAKTESALRPLPRSFEVPSLGDLAAGMSEALLRCPVCACSEYLDCTSGIVNRPRRRFVSSKCPSRAMSKNDISYMLRAFIIQSSASSRCGQHWRHCYIVCLFSVTGLFGELWRWRCDVQTRFFHLFICGVYPLLQMEFTLLVHLLLLVNALGSSHLFLTCFGGGGGVILVCFPRQLA